MCGNGRPRISCRLPALLRTPTRITRCRGSIRARCCAAEASPPVRGSRDPATETSSRPSATTSSPGFVPARCEHAGQTPFAGPERGGKGCAEGCMQSVMHPVLKDVVLIGAGHAHVAVLRMFGMAPLPGARFTLITREVHSPYSGMLPGLIAGHYQFDDAHIDTAPLARFAGARLYQDEAVGLDLVNRRVICRSRPAVPYDLLSINIGSTPNTTQIPGASEHAIAVKPIDGFLGRFMAMQERVIRRKGHARIAVVGAGAGGIELVLSVVHRLRREVASAGFDSAG